jgi:hypothetical protein
VKYKSREKTVKIREKNIAGRDKIAIFLEFDTILDKITL